MRRIYAALLAAFVGALVTASVLPAEGQTFNVTIPDGVSTGPEGSVEQLASDPVNPADVGQTCDVTVNVVNNDSLHPGNDILVASNGGEVVAANVEDQPGTSTYPAVGVLTLGPTVTVSIRFGPDGIRSEGYSVDFECSPAPPPPDPPVPPEPDQQLPGQQDPEQPVPVTATPRFTG
ncbi:MAG: hypothetical protein ACRDWD_13285 [Acidimicrobiia bacterium]